MIEKGKISAFQLAILMFPVVVATGDLWAPATAAKYAGRDLWMVPLLSSAAGFLLIWITYQLHRMYPNKTIIQYSDQILGRFLGKIISFIYLITFIKSVATISRQYAEFIAGAFLSHTPRVVIIGTMLFVCAIAVRLGIEIIARAGQIFVPLVMLAWLVIIILLIPDMDIRQMLPIMEKGVVPIAKGSVQMSGYFLHFTVLTFLLPLVSDQKNAVKWGFGSVTMTMLTLAILDWMTFLVLGENTASQTYPIMSAVKYIEVADFVEHLESIVMAIWVAGAFIKISVFYYIFILGMAQWLELDDYRSMVFPFSILALSCSFWFGATVADLSEFLSSTNLLFDYTTKLVLPVFLLIIALIRKKFHKTKVSNV